MNQIFTLIFVLLAVSLVSGGQLSSQYLPPRQNFGGFSGNYGGPQVPINRYDNTNDGDGNYNYRYDTGNGISVQEQGYLKNPGSGNEAETVQGSYSYTAPDGQRISVSYTADANGFHPVGAHLPTPPPIPDAILKSLEFNRAEESRGGYRGDEGQYRQGYQY